MSNKVEGSAGVSEKTTSELLLAIGTKKYINVWVPKGAPDEQ